MDFSEPAPAAFSAVLAERAVRLLRFLILWVGGLAVLTGAALLWSTRLVNPIGGELIRSGLLSLPLASLLLLLGGLAGTAILARTRLVACQDPDQAWRIGTAARLPQLSIIPLSSLSAAALAWRYLPSAGPVLVAPGIAYTLGGAAVALAFLLLIAERLLAGTSARILPEAAALRALGFVAVTVCFVAGVVEIAATLGAPYTGKIGYVMAILVAAIGLELAARAAGRGFLPPPDADSARAAATSVLARLIVVGARAQGGLAAPIRQHLGIDFSRSWALAYVRAAALPLACTFLLLGWALSGVVLVRLDKRAVYERFGAPVAVLHPGLHVVLPWPMGAIRTLDFGAVHEIGLADIGPSGVPRLAAEDPAPASADRLWEQAHPGEVTLLIASAAGSKQSFQSVSADIRVLYRVGLTDDAALHAAYATVAPEDLVRAGAGRVVAQYVAGRTLDAMLGANREAMAEGMRTRMQQDLDAAGSGMDIVAVAIEAIHPPAGAADAYHNVRAAEISANASIAVERGAAATIDAQSRQSAFAQTANAQAGAVERMAAAQVGLIRFQADQGAAQAGGRSFMLERYFTDLVAALGRAPKTIIDHRLNWPEAPVLDLRPLAAAGATTGGKEE